MLYTDAVLFAADAFDMGEVSILASTDFVFCFDPFCFTSTDATELELPVTGSFEVSFLTLFCAVIFPGVTAADGAVELVEVF